MPVAGLQWKILMQGLIPHFPLPLLMTNTLLENLQNPSSSKFDQETLSVRVRFRCTLALNRMVGFYFKCLQCRLNGAPLGPTFGQVMKVGDGGLSALGVL